MRKNPGLGNDIEISTKANETVTTPKKLLQKLEAEKSVQEFEFSDDCIVEFGNTKDLDNFNQFGIADVESIESDVHISITYESDDSTFVLRVGNHQELAVYTQNNKFEFIAAEELMIGDWFGSKTGDKHGFITNVETITGKCQLNIIRARENDNVDCIELATGILAKI